MKEPGSILFKDAPVKSVKTDTNRVPGSLSFKSESVAKKGPSPLSAGPSAAPANIGALVFKDPAPVAGKKVFSGPAHPLFATVMAELAKKHSADYASYEEALGRYVTKLLPLTSEAVENFGLRVLEESRDNVMEALRLTEHYKAINASSLIDSLVGAAPRTSGLLGLLPRKKPSVALAKGALEATATSLRELLPAVRDALKEDRHQKLSNYLIALSAVASNSNLVANPTLERSVNSKLSTLQSALVQAKMLPTQLKSLEEAAMSNLAQCEKLLFVGLGALGMADAQPGSLR